MKLLVVDDDEIMQLTMKNIFKGEEIHIAESASQAEALLSAHVFNAALLDIQIKGESDGISLLKRIRTRDPFLPVIMISGLDDRGIILKCLEEGAVDYVVKGVVNPEAYRLALVKASHWRKLLSDSTSQHRPMSLQALEEIKGESKPIQELRAQISKLGKLPGPFLILGETGTGKELVARSLWAAMGDKNRPFVAINCASLPENLVESELFGYEKGAFTGALQSKPGLFEAANGGDIFLDEIGELPLPLQAKLLRVLQEKTVRRLGSDRERPLQVRVISATHADIASGVESKSFREDLFYRLNVHVLQVPQLSERGEDLFLLLKTFLAQVGFRNVHLPEETIQLMKNYRWPGNIRQLRSFSEYLRGHLDQVRTEVTPDLVLRWFGQNSPRRKETSDTGVASGLKTDLSQISLELQKVQSEGRSVPIVDLMDHVQRLYVEAAMKLTKGNRTNAAKLLGVSRQRLCNWLSHWGLDV